jgi:TPR repeat protein
MLVKSCAILVLILIMLSPATAIADMQEYIREYTHRVGDADSKVTSRQISMQEIKVELLGELGTYINSRVEISQGNLSETEFKEEITSLTAGFVRVEMLEERFNGETYYLKAKLSADPDDVVVRINQFSKSTLEDLQIKQKLVQEYQHKNALIAQLVAIQEDITFNKTTGNETKSLEKQYIEESKKLSTAELVELGYDYLVGRKGKPQDYGQAAVWIRKAAEQGHAASQYNLGHMYQQGYGVAKDYSLAISWYRKAAEQGHASAQNNLGSMYGKGFGVAKDESQAISWLRKAAKQRNPNAQNNLGLFYQAGIGTSKDEKQAISWFRKSAEQGHPEAQYNLGVMYTKGAGVKANAKKTMYWMRKSADQDHANAQYKVARMYGKGYGVKKDADLALFWLRKAAEQGNAEAQYFLGGMYGQGNGLTKDYDQAAVWIRKAAEQEHAEAQYVLAIMYGKGNGVTKDYALTTFWIRKAAEQGHEKAKMMLIKIESTINK